jgi:hypothetical protein
MTRCLPAAVLALVLSTVAVSSYADPVRYEFVGSISDLYGANFEARPDVETVFPLGSPISFFLCWEPETPSSFPGEYLGAILGISVSHANYTAALTLGLVSVFVWPDIPSFNGYGDVAGPSPVLLPTIRPAFVEFSLGVGGAMLAQGPPLFIPEGALDGNFTLVFRDPALPEPVVFVNTTISSVRAVPMPGTLPLYALGVVFSGLRFFYRRRR